MESRTASNVVIGVALLVWAVYAVIGLGNILLGLLPLVLVAGGYTVWWIYSSVRDIRESLHRIADQLERME